MKIGVEKGRQTRADLKIGICGEHGGDPDSVMFCHSIGLNYVSCSPVPRADRPPGRGPGGHGKARRRQGRASEEGKEVNA